MPIQTPICDFGQKAHNFQLKSTDNKIKPKLTKTKSPVKKTKKVSKK